MSLEVEILKTFGIFARENSPLVEVVKQIIENIDFEGKNYIEIA